MYNPTCNLNHVHGISKLSNYTFFFQIATENAGSSGEAGSVVMVTFTSFVAVRIFHAHGNRHFPLG